MLTRAGFIRVYVSSTKYSSLFHASLCKNLHKLSTKFNARNPNVTEFNETLHSIGWKKVRREHFVKETSHVYLHMYKITVKKGPTGNALIPSGLSDCCPLTSPVNSIQLQFANLVTSGGKNKLIIRLSKVTVSTFVFVELVESVECRGSHCGLRMSAIPPGHHVIWWRFLRPIELWQWMNLSTSLWSLTKLTGFVIPLSTCLFMAASKF